MCLEISKLVCAPYKTVSFCVFLRFPVGESLMIRGWVPHDRTSTFLFVWVVCEPSACLKKAAFVQAGFNSLAIKKLPYILPRLIQKNLSVFFLHCENLMIFEKNARYSFRSDRPIC